MLYVAHENDALALSALALLRELGASTLILTGADPVAPANATTLFTSPKGRFPGKFLRVATSLEALLARDIHVPTFARTSARLVALRVRQGDQGGREQALKSALLNLSGLFPPKRKRERYARWRANRNLRARDNGLFG
jgi:hypothetical protein